MTVPTYQPTRVDFAAFLEAFAYSDFETARGTVVYKHGAPGVISPFLPQPGKDYVVLYLGAGYVDDYEVAEDAFSLKLRSRGTAHWVTLPFAAVVSMFARKPETAPEITMELEEAPEQTVRHGLRLVKS